MSRTKAKVDHNRTTRTESEVLLALFAATLRTAIAEAEVLLNEQGRSLSYRDLETALARGDMDAALARGEPCLPEESDDYLDHMNALDDVQGCRWAMITCLEVIDSITPPDLYGMAGLASPSR